MKKTERNSKGGIAYILTTLKCNAQCRHCYVEAGPKRTESMGLKDLKKVLDQLVGLEFDLISISGGEALLEKEKVLEIGRYLKKRKTMYGYPKYVEIQTNAFWATGDERAESVLEELLDAGYNQIMFSSDEFHGEYIPVERPRRGYELAKKLRRHEKPRKFKKVEFTADYKKYDDGNFAVPIGRGKTLPKEDLWIDKGPCMIYGGLADGYVTINPKGDVYPCCWQATKSIGNALETSMRDILKRMKKDPVLKKLYLGGIDGLVEYLGIDPKYAKQKIKRLGTCGFCYELFKDYIGDSDEKR